MIWALVLLPMLVGISLFALPRRADRVATAIALLVAVACIAMTLVISPSENETAPWLGRPLSPFVASFHVSLGRGLGFWLTFLTALINACALVATRTPRQRDFVAWMLLLEGAMTGVFVARDLLLFALFWDLMLIPVFFIMVGWGVGHRASAWRYLIFNVSGGLLLLLAVAGYGFVTGSTDVLSVPVIYGAHAPFVGLERWLFAGFAIAFLIKTPVWPLHTWMPPTYADLPAPAVAIVSAVQSKAGLYGFALITPLLFPEAMHRAAPMMIALGSIGLVYGAFAALRQSDVKRIVAYSSLSHLGLMLVALFSFEPIARAGAAVYIVAHALFSAALFLMLGAVERRTETRALSRLGGLGTTNPRLAGALSIAALAALGLPGLCGFTGEILILSGIYHGGLVWPTFLALLAIVLAAAYMLRLFQGIMHGPRADDLPERADLRVGECVAFAPLVIGMIWLGVAPGSVVRAIPPPIRVESKSASQGAPLPALIGEEMKR